MTYMRAHDGLACAQRDAVHAEILDAGAHARKSQARAQQTTGGAP